MYLCTYRAQHLAIHFSLLGFQLTPWNLLDFGTERFWLRAFWLVLTSRKFHRLLFVLHLPM